MEIKKTTDTWVVFRHHRETSYFKEESPNVFVLRGYFDGVTMGRDNIEADGILYTSSKEYEIGKARMNLDSIDYRNKEFTEEYYFFRGISEYKTELPPFGVIKVLSPKYMWGLDDKPDIEAPFYDMSGNLIVSCGYSENYEANQLMFLAERLGCGAYTAKGSREKEGSEMIFHYCVYGYGYQNAVYAGMRFDDILNMDCTIFSADALERLESYCHKICVIDDCLNFDVFKRPLTDVEKLQGSLLFVDWYNKYRQYQSPHGKRPRINQFDKRDRERYKFKLPKSWKQQRLKELTELQ